MLLIFPRGGGASCPQGWGLTDQMRVLELLDDGDVVELDVEELVHALEGAAELDVVLELDCDFVVDERLEEAVGGWGGGEESALKLVTAPAMVW